MPSANSRAHFLRGRNVPSLALAALLLATIVIAALCGLLASQASASVSAQYGQVQRFGEFDVSAAEGKTPEGGKFLEPRGFAVDTQDSTGGPHDTAVYVLDRTNPSAGEEETAWRIQKLSETGAVLATTTFKLDNHRSQAIAVQGLAVDHAAGRLYALVVGQPTGAGEEPVAEELVAWSTTPESEKLVAASGLTADALGTGAGRVSSKTQLETEGPTPLYQPQGIAVDPAAGAGTDSPVAIEATDLEAGSEAGGSPPGNTIVQQVATSAGTVGALGERWSSASVATQLGGKSYGPGGISLNPDGSLTALLNNVGEQGAVYAVRLSSDLQSATVLDSQGSLPPGEDLDERPFAGLIPPFADAGLKEAISQSGGSGSQLIQLSTPTSNTTGGLYAAMFSPAKAGSNDPQTGGSFYFHYGDEERLSSSELYFQANIGVRLLQRNEDGEISDQKGGTIENTLGSSGAGNACSFDAGSSLAFAAGAEGALWVLVQGPSAELIKGGLDMSNTATGDKVIELEPGAGSACPTAAGNFAMQPAGGASQPGDTELNITAGTTVKFNAATLEMQGGVPFSYQWQLDKEEPTNGLPVNEMVAPAYLTPPATAEYTYATEGVYKVKLTVLSDYGSYTTSEGTIKVSGHLSAPTAQFKVSTASPRAGAPVTFDASGSQAGSGTITAYEWKWGDGGSESLSASGTTTFNHTYSKAGPYLVELVVTNSANLESTVFRQEVTVGAPEEKPAEKAKETPKEAPKETPSDHSPTEVSPRASESKATGALKLALTCPATKVSCSGTIKIETAGAVAAKKRAKRKRVVLGQATFSLKGGESQTLTLHLSSAGAKLLSKLKHIQAVILVSAQDSFGDPATQSVSVTLTVPAAKHKKHH